MRQEEDWGFINTGEQRMDFNTELADLINKYSDDQDTAIEAARTILGYAASILQSMPQDSVPISDDGVDYNLSLTPVQPEVVH